jgi:hypothetical protein
MFDGFDASSETLWNTELAGGFATLGKTEISLCYESLYNAWVIVCQSEFLEWFALHFP